MKVFANSQEDRDIDLVVNCLNNHESGSSNIRPVS